MLYAYICVYVFLYNVFSIYIYIYMCVCVCVFVYVSLKAGVVQFDPGIGVKRVKCSLITWRSCPIQFLTCTWIDQSVWGHRIPSADEPESNIKYADIYVGIIVHVKFNSSPERDFNPVCL